MMASVSVFAMEGWRLLLALGVGVWSSRITHSLSRAFGLFVVSSVECGQWFILVEHGKGMSLPEW